MLRFLSTNTTLIYNDGLFEKKMIAQMYNKSA